MIRERGGMLGIWCFSAGLALTAATQLRAGGLPVGPGELLLLLWLAGSLSAVLWSGRVTITRVGRAVTLFWASALGVVLLGGLVGIWRGAALGPFLHDLLAFLFAAVVVLVFTTQPDLAARARAALPLVIAFTVAPLMVLLLTGGRIPGLGSLRVWYADIRFTGWAENPNQPALTLAPIPFLGYYLLRQAGSGWRRAGYAALILGSLVLGVLTRSDALVLAWLVALACALLLGWYRALTGAGAGLWTRATAAVLLPAAALACLAVVGPRLLEGALDSAIGVYQTGGQGSVRFLLWRHGLQAMAHSPLVGSGPGAHSGLTGPFQGSESHSTVVDWGASAGLIGLTLYFGLVLWVLYRAWSARQVALLVSVLALFTFSLLHYVLRHPLFWFYLVAAAALAGRVPAPGAPGSRAPVPERDPARHRRGA